MFTCSDSCNSTQFHPVPTIIITAANGNVEPYNPNTACFQSNVIVQLRPDNKPYQRTTSWLDNSTKYPYFLSSRSRADCWPITEEQPFATGKEVKNQLRNDSNSDRNTASSTDDAMHSEVVHNRKQFGISLEHIQQNYDLPLEWPIPPIVEKCIASLSIPEHLVTEGIFRKSPLTSKVKELRDKFDAGIDVDFDGEDCALAAAALLKIFFQELPDPLLTLAVMEDVMQFQQIPRSKRTMFIKNVLVEKVPSHNYALLKCLAQFLSMVSVADVFQQK